MWEHARDGLRATMQLPHPLYARVQDQAVCIRDSDGFVAVLPKYIATCHVMTAQRAVNAQQTCKGMQ